MARCSRGAQVGSDDYEIRIFQREEVVSEATETDRVIALTPIRLKRCARVRVRGIYVGRR